MQWHIPSSYNHIDLMCIHILRGIMEDFLLGRIIVGHSGRETRCQLAPRIPLMLLINRVVYKLRNSLNKLSLGILRNDCAWIHSSVVFPELIRSENEQGLLVFSQESITFQNFQGSPHL